MATPTPAPATVSRGGLVPSVSKIEVLQEPGPASKNRFPKLSLSEESSEPVWVKATVSPGVTGAPAKSKVTRVSAGGAGTGTVAGWGTPVLGPSRALRRAVSEMENVPGVVVEYPSVTSERLVPG